MAESGDKSNRSNRFHLRCLMGAIVVAFFCGSVPTAAESRGLNGSYGSNRDESTTTVRLRNSGDDGRGKGVRFSSQRPFPDAPLEVVASLDARPIGVAMSPDERLFTSLAGYLGDVEQKDGGVIRELLPDGSSRPFPLFSSSDSRSPGDSFSKVIALAADSREVLWILDSGLLPTSQPKLVGWDLKKEALHRLVYLPAPITKPNSSLVSVAIDEKRQIAYIADQGRGDFVGKSESAIISVDLKTGAAWRALEDHYSLNADGGDFIVKGEPLLAPDGKGSLVRPSLGIASVSLDEQGDFVYFGAANGRSVFRITTEVLSDSKLSSAQVGERVQRLGDKPPSHGLFVLSPEQVLVSDVNNNAIGLVSPTGRYEMLATSEELSWPTAFARGSRGEVYVVSSQFHRAPLFHRGEDQSKRPFLITRFYPQPVRQEAMKTRPVADQKKRLSRR